MDYLAAEGNKKIPDRPTGLAQKTIKRKLSECSAFYRWCLDRGYADAALGNPFKDRELKTKRDSKQRSE